MDFKGFDEGFLAVHIGGDNLDTLGFKRLGFGAGGVASNGSYFIRSGLQSVRYDGTSLSSGGSNDCQDRCHCFGCRRF